MPLTSQAKTNIQAHLDAATAPSDPNHAPGVFFTAVDRQGNVLTQSASGVRSTIDKTPISPNSVFWLASCTKLITSIAVMQLVEQGRLDLDSSAQLYSLLPELAAKRDVYVAPGTWEPRNADITLRMLLSHTAGFGYSFMNERLRDWARPCGLEEFSGDWDDIERSPLVNQPGTRWEYGVNIDWAGKALERLTGSTLGAYMQRHVFAPLGVLDTAMQPDRHMRAHLVHLHQRLPNSGGLLEIDHSIHRAISRADGPDAHRVFHSGGAGLFAKPAEFVKVLAALLNDGVSAQTGARILKKETVESMFVNQVPQFPRYAYTGIPAAKPLMTHPLPVLYAQEGAPDQVWGLSMHLTTEAGATGRGRNTGWWAGIVNLFWWVDREKGVAGMLAGAVYPFADAALMGAWAKCEAEVYQGLDGAKI